MVGVPEDSLSVPLAWRKKGQAPEGAGAGGTCQGSQASQTGLRLPQLRPGALGTPDHHKRAPEVRRRSRIPL